MIKKMKRKRIISILFIMIVGTLIGFIIGRPGSSNFSSTMKKNNPLAIMLQQSDDTYQPYVGNAFPGSDYVFNGEMSFCINGSQLSWGENGLTILASQKDFCTIYFDEAPADFKIRGITIDGASSSTFPTGSNYTVATNCSGATATWNYANWGLDVTSVTSASAYCSLTFTSKTNPTYLNTYVKDQSVGTCSNTSYTTASTCETAGGTWTTETTAGKCTDTTYTTQSDCETANKYWYNIVHETGKTVDISTYTQATSYNNINYISGTSYYSLSNGIWTATGVSSSAYYRYVSFSPSSNGYYKLQYTLPAGTTNNRLYIYLNDTSNSAAGTSADSNYEDFIYGSTTEEKKGKYDFGYLTTSDVIKIGIRYNQGNTFYLEGTTQENTIDTGYRYEGSNPNNYIKFNNEIWRIIGVFDTELSDGTTQSLTKIIRNESIGGYAFDGGGGSYNYWVNTSGTRSNLNILLNDYYYNASSEGTSNAACVFWGLPLGRNCDYSKIGLQSTYRSMVENVKWYLGGYDSATYVNGMYTYERGTTLPSSGTNAATSTGYIGLMYPSDYGYSVLASSCARDTYQLKSYSNAECAGKAWLLQNGYEWTIAPDSSDTGSVWSVLNNGNLYVGSAFSGFAARPVLYLKSSTYIVSGDGTMSNPYIINGE